jgi:acyl carrier protein
MSTTTTTAPSAASEPEPADRAQLDEQVRLIIADSLGRDQRQVTLEASLTEDLNAESLDLLDIVFRLERAFDVQITRGEIERAARGDMTDEEFAPDGIISPAGLDRLRTLMPEAAARIKPGLRPINIPGLFTVRTFASIVEAKRAQAKTP